MRHDRSGAPRDSGHSGDQRDGRWVTWRPTGGRGHLNVTFYGVRGSTPCPCDANRRYGGNTACVAVEAPGFDPIVLDLGTGLRYWGDMLPTDGSFRGSALITHLHWDHVQGLPFFVPIDRPGARLDVYGPVQDGVTLEEAFEEFMRPPYFPVRFTELRGEHPVPRRRRRRHRGRRRQGQGARRCRTSAPPTATASSWAAWRSPTSATTNSRCDGSDSVSRRRARALRRRRPADPRRPVHARGVRGEVALGPLHRRLRRARGRGGAGRSAWRCSTTIPSHDDGFVDGLRDHATAGAERLGLEVVAAAEGLTVSLSGAAAHR